MLTGFDSSRQDLPRAPPGYFAGFIRDVVPSDFLRRDSSSELVISIEAMHHCVVDTMAANGGTIPPLPEPSELCDCDEQHRHCDIVELNEMDGDQRLNNLGKEIVGGAVYHLCLRHQTVSTECQMHASRLMDVVDVFDDSRVQLVPSAGL